MSKYTKLDTGLSLGYNAGLMIKLLRNQKHWFIGIALAVSATFIATGVIMNNDSKSPSTLASLDGQSISLSQYRASYNAISHQAMWVYGDKLPEMRKRIDFKGEAWDRLLLLHEAKKQNIKTSDQEVVEWIVKQSIFSPKGQFDKHLYKLYVSQYFGSNSREFEEEIRGLLTIQKIADSVRSKVQLSDEELKKLYDGENGERNLSYGHLPWESQAKDVKIDDKEVEQIYPIVKDKLTDPERVKLSYLFVPKEKEEELKALFSEKGNLQELSKKYNLPLKETTYFSKNEAVPDIGLSKEVLSLSFSLALHQESDWVRLDQGAYKISIADKKAEHALSLEEARDSIKRILSKQKAIQLTVEKLKEIKKKITKPEDFESVLKNEGVETKTFDKFKKGTYLPGAGPSESYESNLWSLKEGEVSDAIAVPTGAAIFKILKYAPADEKKFNEEKDKFKEKTIDEKTQVAMRSLLETSRKELKVNLETMKTIFNEE